MKLVSCLCVVMLLLCGAVTPVQSQTIKEDPYDYPLRDMPTGQVITNQGVQYKAFTLDEYRQLALIYSDYVYILKQNLSLNASLSLYLDIEKNYELQLVEVKNLNDLYKLDRDYWMARVKDEQEANKRRELLSDLERFGAWALVAVEAIALGALGVARIAQ